MVTRWWAVQSGGVGIAVQRACHVSGGPSAPCGGLSRELTVIDMARHLHGRSVWGRSWLCSPFVRGFHKTHALCALRFVLCDRYRAPEVLLSMEYGPAAGAMATARWLDWDANARSEEMADTP